MALESAIQASYAHCRQIAKQSGSNFYRSFYLLRRPKRRAMWALYAFLRHTDDLSDGTPDAEDNHEARRKALAEWRHSLERALDGKFDNPLQPALKDVVDRYGIPHEYLTAVIDGMEMDLGPCRYDTFDQLKLYCHRVASVVGLACIHIWGFRDEVALGPAADCGIAFQLTNILRDLKEDVCRDRVYLPQEDLDRFGYTTADLRAGICDHRFRQLMMFQIERAEKYYESAITLSDYLGSDGRRIYGAMVSTYHGLLKQIHRAGGNVLHGRVRVGRLRKIWIAAKAFLSGRLIRLR